MKAYYNEIDKNAAAWLRQLIKNGNITDGEVDERSIIEVEPGDVRGFDRVHWFAGIGTWDYCLNRAGWTGRPVWTASLPCQPFSVAGRQKGKDDERHLLPHFLELVRQCKPECCLGEQVQGAVKHGWLDDLHDEMGREGYTVGATVLTAAGAGLPHIRQRLFWVAHAKSERGCQRGAMEERHNKKYRGPSEDGWMGNTESEQKHTTAKGGFLTESCNTSGLVQPNSDGCEQGCKTTAPKGYWDTADAAGGVDWLYCRDNKYRPVPKNIKPCLTALANGTAGRMVYSGNPGEEINANDSSEARAMRLKGYGNAIVAPVATAFIKAYMSLEKSA